jgi:uncharacterized repeat protein (TIGR02543 family)
MTVYAKWVAVQSFAVTYNDQDATVHVLPQTQTVTAPAMTVGALPMVPVKTGYSFVGWYTEISGGTEFTASTPVSRDITVYARWNSCSASFTITYNALNADIQPDPTSQTVISPQTTVVSLPSAPQKAGCTFQGWYSGNGIKFTEKTAVTESITVYAGWQCDR